MNGFGYFVMLGWIPAVLFLFSKLPIQRALILSFLIAWLFLPMAEIELAGIPNYTKMSATCYGILLATFIFDIDRFKRFRPHWVDIPTILWCLCPGFSSLANGLGFYDAISAILSQTVTWGFPYFLGRLYLGTLNGLQQLAIAIVWGGLIYVPLCLLEIRLSPQLHQWLYGFYPQAFDQAIRYGGFRPIIFMQHGLMVGTWMMTATLIAFWFWRTGSLQPFLQQFAWGTPAKVAFGRDNPWGMSLAIFLGLLATFVLVKATGAYFLFLLGIALVLGMRWWQTSLPLLLVVAAMCGYLIFNTTGGMTPQTITQLSAVATRVTNADRASSLVFRLANEAELAAKARQQPIFGWGGWGRARIYDDFGKDISVTDSLWIINFGNYGYVGLFSWMGALLLPVLGFVLLRYPASMWLHPQVLPAAVLSIGLVLYVMDCLVNGMINPIYTLIAGGIAGLVTRPTARPTARPLPQRQETPPDTFPFY
ncbi:O-antigen ligase domain-containing protein [Altericista sp. CCNU0014]|uniref:O-antigen ligase domain-containing protein n=1 Tax=Altericista sp. CCNU0014 TaxID=3082949 RepID=UPI00384FC547